MSREAERVTAESFTSFFLFTAPCNALGFSLDLQ